MVAAGAVLLFVGLCTLAAAFGKTADADQLVAGAGFFSVGALAVAAGIYMKARACKRTRQRLRQQKKPQRRPKITGEVASCVPPKPR